VPGHRIAGWSRRGIGELRKSEGQAILEFVLVLPLVVTLVFVMVQFGIAFNNYLQVTDAARVAARAAAVARFKGDTPCNAAQGVIDGLNNKLHSNPDNPNDVLKLDPTCSTTCPPTPGATCSLKVTFPWSVSVPLISDGGTLSSTATEPIE
jgi:TadE-like protein